MANENVLNGNVQATDSDTTLAIAGENDAVAIEILPSPNEPQTGAPDSPIVWLVVIKNIGNAPDTFIVTPTSNKSWGANLDNSSWASGAALDPATKSTSYLTEHIPITALTGDSDTITVDVDGTLSDTSSAVTLNVLEPGPRIPEGVIEISVEAKVVAIELLDGRTTWNFGILDEGQENHTGNDWFTVRNTGNVPETISVQGTDAVSMPGEPTTSWALSNTIGVDQYVLNILTPAPTPLAKSSTSIWTGISPGSEKQFGLQILAPSVITTPARMWARVKLTAIAA
jgi:hypothetical protein